MVCGSIGCLPDVGSVLCRGKGKEKCKHSGIAVSFFFSAGAKENDSRSWKNDFYALSCPKRTWSRKSRKYFLSHGKDDYKDSGGGYDKAAKKAGIISLSSNDYGKRKNLYSGRDAV